MDTNNKIEILKTFPFWGNKKGAFSDLESGSYIVKVVSAIQGHYSVNVIVK